MDSTVEKPKKKKMKTAPTNSKANKYSLKKFTKKEMAPKDFQEKLIDERKYDTSKKRETQKEKESMAAKVLGDLASKPT